MAGRGSGKTAKADELGGGASAQSFEEVIGRLEAIAGRLESGEPALEEALQLFEEGVGLAKVGTSRLDEAERRIELLLENGTTQPMQLAGEGPDE